MFWTVSPWVVSDPILEEPEYTPSLNQTKKRLRHHHHLTERTDQHNRTVLTWTMFSPEFGWLYESRKHLDEIFDEGGYSDQGKNETPLGPLYGACHSAVLLDPSDRMQAFSVTLKPPNGRVKTDVYGHLVSEGVPSKLTLQQYSDDKFPDFNAQPMIRSEVCDVHPGVFTLWLGKLNSWYLNHINTGGRYAGVSGP